jgi:hypothetical protein
MSDVTLRRAQMEITQRERIMWHIEHSTGEFWLCRDKVAVAAESESSKAAGLASRTRAALEAQGSINRRKATAINNAPGRHKIEELLPWHATGTLSRRDADRVKQVLAGDRELARRYELVSKELTETIRLNETLGAPSARAMEKLFAAIDAAEASVPRRRRRPISRTRFLTPARDSTRQKPSLTK